ncbi:MAG: hypothetical protein AAF655_25410, partial [Bacteroidota bacterium]
MRKIFYTLVLCGFLSPALALELGYTGTFSKTELNTSLAFSTSAPLQASSLQYDPYYDGFDDFRFSRRIRRFHGGGFGGGFGYYDPYFTNDVYFAIGTPLWNRWYAPRRVFLGGGFVTRSFFFGLGVGSPFYDAWDWCPGWYGFGNWYNPWRFRSWGFGGGFGFGIGFNNFGWGWNRGFGNRWAFNRGFNNGFVNGYRYGFRDGFNASNPSDRWYQRNGISNRNYVRNVADYRTRGNRNLAGVRRVPRPVNGGISNRARSTSRRYVVNEYEPSSRARQRSTSTSSRSYRTPNGTRTSRYQTDGRSRNVNPSARTRTYGSDRSSTYSRSQQSRSSRSGSTYGSSDRSTRSSYGDVVPQGDRNAVSRDSRSSQYRERSQSRTFENRSSQRSPSRTYE